MRDDQRQAAGGHVVLQQFRHQFRACGIQICIGFIQQPYGRLHGHHPRQGDSAPLAGREDPRRQVRTGRNAGPLQRAAQLFGRGTALQSNGKAQILQRRESPLRRV